MSGKKQRLELTWIGKDERPKLEPRILLEEKTERYSRQRGAEDIVDNRLIFGDNLLALKALETEFAGKVKCIYIDPPFNTGAMFDLYDDGVEHSIWLQQMRDRLTILNTLLHPSGVIWIHIDDKELAYLKVVCDETFGRLNFLNMVVVKTSDPSGHKTVNPSPYSQTEYILMYSKDRNLYKYSQRYVEAAYDPGYSRYVINKHAPYEEWKFIGLNEHVSTLLGCEDTRAARKKFGKIGFDAQVAQFALENALSVFQPTAISDAAGRLIVEVRDRSAREPGSVFLVQRQGYDDLYIANGRQIYFYASKIRSIEGELVPAKPLTNLWTDVPWNGIAREGGVEFKNGKKPEKLIQRCIELSTTAGDLVLDSFSGSGTTGAVAHKMGRRWIMVELGEHCHTHIIPRLKKVIDGEDRGGITEAVGWKGGGGFRYFRLAPSLLEKDRWNRWVIARSYNAAMLAEAMCKHMGFTYAPSQDPAEYWRHGHSSERDFIFVTTANLTHDQLRVISEDVGAERTLLICCKAFNARTDVFGNLTVNKIPQSVLTRCEWGRDDYSLRIAEAASQFNDPDVPPAPAPAASKRGRRVAAAEPSLFPEPHTELKT